MTELTPVEEHQGIFFKRDDLYAPYGENFITGGKIRKCRDLIKTNLLSFITKKPKTASMIFAHQK